MPVEISAFGIEVMILPRPDIHPFIKMMPQHEHGDEEQGHDGEERGDVFQLAPHDHAPFRVGGVMHDRPEETAGAEREVEGERRRETKN